MAIANCPAARSRKSTSSVRIEFSTRLPSVSTASVRPWLIRGRAQPDSRASARASVDTWAASCSLQRSNMTGLPALNTAPITDGQLTFSSLANFLQGSASSFLWDPKPTEMNWRSLFGAWYVSDVIRIAPRLTLSLGFRDEFTSGWNEAHGRAASYTFSNGVISNSPHIGDSLFTTNHAKFLPEPRIGLAWSPLSDKTVIRAGFGMFNDLQDALGYRTDQNAPFNPVYSVGSAATPFQVSSLPIDPTAPPPTGAKLVPGGVQPDMKTPTLLSWSLRVQQEVSPNTSLTVGYVGSHGYHELIGIDANEPFPVVCPASPCPATYPNDLGMGVLSGAPVP